MKKTASVKNPGGFALISLILVLILVGTLATMQLTKHLKPEEEKDKKPAALSTTGVVTIPQARALTDEARNIAGRAALDAAAANVRSAYAKFLMTNPAGGPVTAQTVANLLNERYTRVGDYTVSYTASGTDRVTVTLQAGSKGQFGTPNLMEISLR